MKNFKKLGFTVILLLLVSFAFSQGNTNSSLSGKVEDKDGTLPGASVLVVHTPSGTKYSASTDENGYFRISNMRTGDHIRLPLLLLDTKQSLEMIFI